MRSTGRVVLCFEIFLLIYIGQCDSSLNTTIMFDLNGKVNSTFLNTVLKWYKRNNFYMTEVTDGKFNLTDFPSLDIYASDATLNSEKKRIEDANTLITIGQKSYFGEKLSQMNISTSFKRFSMRYLPIFEFPISTKVEIIRQIHSHMRMTQSNGQKSTLYVLEPITVNPQKPWEKVDILSMIMKSVESSSRFILYRNNAKEIANRIRDYEINNIVVMVNSDAAKSLIMEAKIRNLLKWNNRWVFLLPSESTLDIRNLGFQQRSANLTIIQFANRDTNLSFPLHNSFSCVAFDTMDIVLKLVSQLYRGTAISAPEKINGTTGTFTIDYSKLYSTTLTEVCTKTTWVMQVFHGLGKEAKLVGNFSGTSDDGNVTMSVPPYHTNNITTNFIMEDLRDNPFRIITILETPFVQYKKNASKYPNLVDKLEGLVIDIMKELMARINISYTLTLDPSGVYGTVNKNGEWNGMILNVLNGKADLAAQAFSITNERMKVVDFLESFLGYKTSILLKEDDDNGISNMFQFLRPFSVVTWGALLGSVPVTAVIIAILHCMNPNKTNWNIYESLYATLGSLFMGIMTTAPSRPSARIVVCFWWFFSLVMVITFIANYGTYRNLDDVTKTITTVEKILTQHQYKYGTVKDTSYDYMFASASQEYMEKMNKMMRQEFEHGFVNSSEFAVELVKKGKYAFIWDNVINQYFAYKHCLKSTAEFNQYYYGFIIPKNADYKVLFDKTILKMKEDGKLKEILDRYTYLGGVKKNPACEFQGLLGYIRKLIPSEIINISSANAFTLDQMLGNFILMICGCVLSLIMAVIECGFLRWYNKRITHQSRQPDQKSTGGTYKKRRNSFT